MIDKKEIKKMVEKEALVYEKYNIKISELEEVKKDAKANIIKLLAKLKLDSVDLDKKAEQLLRVQMVHKKKIDYDVGKIEIIGKKYDVVDLIIKKIVDEKELDNAYNEGIISFKEIEKCVNKVVDSSYLLIKRVKKEIKKEVE